MKNVIVIINPKSGTDLTNVINDATNSQQVPSDVKKVSDRAWLIDPHTSFAFLSGLVHSAQTRHLDAFVFEVDDTLYVPKDWQN